MTAPLLSLTDFGVRFPGGVAAVDGVSLDVAPGETLGIVGESGSGKSQLLLAIMGLLAPEARPSGQIALNGIDLAGLKPAERRALQARHMAMVFQDPASALNPYLTIGRQLTELPMRQGLGGGAARRAALEALERVRMTEAGRRLDQYPHELSGGMRQRAMIAMALVAEPRLILADEPTTALDVTIQAEILAILRDLTRDGMALILVTHDLGVVAHLCRRVTIMYAGRIVETGPVEAIFAAPAHPYAQALLAAMPRLDDDPGLALRAIRGQPPDLAALGPGCAFQPRCPAAMPICTTARPPLETLGPGRQAACFLAGAAS